jgi:hypothetical protein
MEQSGGVGRTLRPVLTRRGCTATIIRACPDGEGVVSENFFVPRGLREFLRSFFDRAFLPKLIMQ